MLFQFAYLTPLRGPPATEPYPVLLLLPLLLLLLRLRGGGGAGGRGGGGGGGGEGGGERGAGVGRGGFPWVLVSVLCFGLLTIVHLCCHRVRLCSLFPYYCLFLARNRLSFGPCDGSSQRSERALSRGEEKL